MSATKRGLLVLCGLILFGTVFCGLFPFVILPNLGLGAGLPAITLPAEVLVKNIIPGFNLTNGITSMLLVDIILITMALAVGKTLRKQSADTYTPKGMLMNVIDMLVEFWTNEASKTLDTKKVSLVLPLVLTVFLFILTANIVKLLPGTETIGITACAEPGISGYPLADMSAPIKMLYVNGLDFKSRAGTKASEEDMIACEHSYPLLRPPSATEESSGIAEAGNPNLFNIIPFFRPLATDINMPLALAIIVFVSVEYWGIKELGGTKYLNKFINLQALGNLRKNPMGIMDFVVGIFELITEFIRIVSLTFRLLASILAGGILLLVTTYLITLIVPLVFFGLEIAIGLIQAYVFALLTIIYAGMAMGHHE